MKRVYRFGAGVCLRRLQQSTSLIDPQSMKSLQLYAAANLLTRDLREADANLLNSKSQFSPRLSNYRLNPGPIAILFLCRQVAQSSIRKIILSHEKLRPFIAVFSR
jgi:hypothetical protein